MFALRSLLGLLACALLASAASAEPKAFLHKGIEADATRYETYLKQNWKPGPASPSEQRTAGRRVLGKDARAASRAFAGAVVGDDRDSRSWLGLAKSLLAIAPDPNNGNERYDLPVNASAAAYRAYHLATSTDDKAEALFVLSTAMQRRSYWRPAINALKTSLALKEAADVRQAYEALRAEHGFRMLDYRTESDIADPRICLQFSERLARTEKDFAKYVSLDGKDVTALDVENKQICLKNLDHGQRYRVQLRAGLPSDIGESLTKALDLGIYVPDRKPFVRFTGKAYVLPSRGQQGIPLVTVNTGAVALEVYRIGDRNLSSQIENGTLERQLSGYDFDEIRTRSGTKVYQGEMAVTSKLNQEATTAFPVTDVIGALKPGAYVMMAEPVNTKAERWQTKATQWFIVSDMGLTAFSGNDGVHAFVRSLENAAPIGGAKVRLVARNNEVLARAETDANGYVRFQDSLTRGEGGLQPATIIAENANGEYAFLDLRANAFDLSDRGVKGREAPGPIDAYLYTERGIYRPGDQVHLSALLRDGAGSAQSLPTTLIVTRPDGVEHARYVLKDQGLGGRTKTVDLSHQAMTGTWRARLHTDAGKPALAQQAFLVEDFVPERLALTLEESDGRLRPGSARKVKIGGKYLYGPAAAGLALEGDIIVRPSKRGVEGFKNFTFGLANEKITPVREPLGDLGRTDEDGKALVDVKLPAIPRTARPLEARVLLRMREPGGRSIERALTMPVESGQPRIGIRKLFDRDGLGEGGAAGFEVVVLDEDNKPTAKTGLKWELVRLETSWQWYNSSGQWLYEPQTITRKVASGTFDVADAAPAKISSDVTYGRYRLDVTYEGDGNLASSVTFNAGWHAKGKSIDSPELLDIALDKKTYRPGDTARLRISNRAAGKVLVAILGDKLHSLKEVEVRAGGTSIDIEVKDGWGTGAYATALFYRPMDIDAKRMPQRSVGVEWLSLDSAPRTLSVALSAPDKVKSGSSLSIPVEIKGLAASEKAYLTVAAVDVGILNLTQHKSPQPESHFYAQHKLAFEIRDFYGRLIDGMRAERGRIRSGGDAGSAMEAAGAPPVEEMLALFSGIVALDETGKATVNFELPEFNGQVRLMAVAWSQNKVGSASQNVTVRDAVALTVSAPRFLTLGDKADLTISLHNVEGLAGDYELTATVSGDPVSGPNFGSKALASEAIPLTSGQLTSKTIAFEPSHLGLHAVALEVTGPGDVAVTRTLNFDVKPPASDIKRTTVAKISANGGTLTLSNDLVKGMIAEDTRVNVSVGPSARFDVPALRTALDRSPYGCAEQTISRALPLLYANAVASELGLGSDTALQTRIQKAVDRVFEMQDGSGAFGAWGPSYTELWLTAYVMDFLSRAREQGYRVKETGYTLALDRLQNFVVNASDFKSGGEAHAYALYVLARNARAPIGELRYYADARLDRFSTPLAKAQIGAALAMMGDQDRANQAFSAAVEALDAKPLSVARSDYGSDLRDGAALLTLTSETGISRSAQPKLIDVVATAYQQRSYTSTQEQAWMLLAVNALQEDVAKLQLSLDGAPVQGSIVQAMRAEELRAKSKVITNNGDDAVEAVISVIGSSNDPQPPAEKGFTLSRRYFTLTGETVDLESASGGASTVKQNDRLVVVVEFESNETSGRILAVDRLPAGLEVENPRLVDSGDIKSLSWLKSDLPPRHTEFRDDRVVAAYHLTPKAEANGETQAKPQMRFAYVVRAVIPGTFVHPALTVEDMYSPERYARSKSGKLIVAPLN